MGLSDRQKRLARMRSKTAAGMVGESDYKLGEKKKVQTKKDEVAATRVKTPEKKVAKKKEPAKKKGPSFGSAFAAARKAGKKEFTWNGKRYHTRTREEEDARVAAAKKAKAKKAKKAKVASTKKPKGKTSSGSWDDIKKNQQAANKRKATDKKTAQQASASGTKQAAATAKKAQEVKTANKARAKEGQGVSGQKVLADYDAKMNKKNRSSREDKIAKITPKRR